MRGIVIIALGKRAYKDLAYNCALTIRASFPDANICLITDRPPTFEDEPMYSKVILTEESNPFLLKTKVYQLSPYKTTLYLDADTVFNHFHFSIKSLLEAPISGDVEMMEFYRVSSQDQADTDSQFHWAGMGALYKKTGAKEIPVLYSGGFRFEKSKPAGAFFREATKQYGGYPPRHTVQGTYPDELAFCVAGAKKQTVFGPFSIFYPTDGTCKNREILGYPFYTLPGGGHTTEQKRLYNAYVKRAAQAYGGHSYPFRK